MKEIAILLDVTPRIVAFHMYTMMKRLGTGAVLVQYAVKHGLVGRELLVNSDSRSRPHRFILLRSNEVVIGNTGIRMRVLLADEQSPMLAQIERTRGDPPLT